MISKEDAKKILLHKYDGIRVEAGIDWEDLWVFRAFLPIGGTEENMNPFLSVEKSTGAVNDFSVTACSNKVELARRFAQEE